MSVAQNQRLNKRLCYLLRYGAVKEGLDVLPGGFVDLESVLKLPLMRHDSREDVLKEIAVSKSSRGGMRFETSTNGIFKGRVLIRARYGKAFEQPIKHQGSNVHTLLQTVVEYVSKNLSSYDLSDFPDCYIINKIFHHLKSQKKLTSSNLRLLLVPSLEHLDLNGVYITSKTLRDIPLSCPGLHTLSLKDCGYVATDSAMENLTKGLPSLRSLNLCACKHITDRTLKTLTKNCPELQHLNLSWITSVTEAGIINFITNSSQIKHLDIYDYSLTFEGVEKLTEIGLKNSMKILNKNIKHPDVTLNDPSSELNLFSKAAQ